MSTYKVLIIQPSVPVYRIDFFQRIADDPCIELSVYHGVMLGGIDEPSILSNKWSVPKCDVFKIGPFFWQRNILNLDVSKFDVIVVSGNLRFLTSILIFLKSILFRKKVVWWSHYRSKKFFVSYFLRYLFYRFSSALLFYTEEEKSLALIEVNPKNKSIFALNNGVSSHAIRKLVTDLESRILDRNQLNILFIGRITPKSNFSLLIEAISELKDRMNVRVHVIGDSGESKVRYLYAKSINHLFIWHGIITDESEIAKVANICNLLVYPGDVGLSLLHGFSYGLPALIHDDFDKHMPEHAAFENNINGFLFEYGNSSSLSNCIHKYSKLSDSEKLFLMKNALETVSNSYNTKDMYLRFMNLITSLKG